MSDKTAIGWTDATINLWWGCVEVSPGCDHCYARVLAKRFGREVWGTHAPRYFTKSGPGLAYKLQKQAEKEGKRIRAFVQSMSDIAEILPANHSDRNRMDDVRAEFFDVTVPACPLVDFQLLTKRVGNYHKILPEKLPPNLWLGISVVNQEEADRDLPKLRVLPGKVHWVSYEPMLGPVTMMPRQIDWVVLGGESGPGHRPMDPAWLRESVAELKHWDVAVFVKQDSGMKDGQQGRIPGELWKLKEFPA